MLLRSYFEPTSARIVRGQYSLLANYVALEPGIPTRMHFTDHYWIKREISDRDTGKTKTVESLVFYVDRLGGEPASRTFSVLSQKLAAHLEPFLKDNQYRGYEFIITEIGKGFYKDWNVQPIPAPEQ